MERTFTTFEVARLCGSFHTTVINWVKKGQLKARVTPGGHRRIPLSSLLEFMKRYEMPIPEDLATTRKRVLVVDDDPVFQRAAVRVIERLPFKPEVEVCGDGLEALVHIGRRPPDLLVTDLYMPAMDGFQVCRVLKSVANTRQIKIIAMTGKTLGADKKAFIRRYSDAFLKKPFDADALAEAATRLLP